MATLRSFIRSLLPPWRPATPGRAAKAGDKPSSTSDRARDLAQPGDVVGGKYRIQKRLGEGGMGTVFLALDESLDREVAIKFLQRRGGGDAKRLFKEVRREARMLAAASHPNVVQVIEVGTSDKGVAFLVMERIAGKTLRLLIEHLGPIDLPTTVTLGAQMARALAHAHGRGVVHADLKPDNVLVTREGQIKVTDFGLSRQLHRTGIGTTGEHLRGCGTPHYMAPELFQGDEPSPASDVYALGATLVELLTGKGLFQKDSEELVSRDEARRRALHAEPASIVLTCGPLAAPLAEWIDRMVAKDPAVRPTAKAVLRALRTERLRLSRHFPDQSDIEAEDEPAKHPGISAISGAEDEPEPLSPYVASFVTAPIPEGFRPRDGLPAGFRAAHRTAPAKPPEPRRPTATARTRPRQETTDPMPPPDPHARPWWKRRQEITDPMPGPAKQLHTDPLLPAPAATKATSIGSVTFPSEGKGKRNTPPARGTDSHRAAPRSAAGLRAVTLIAISSACLSAGLIGRDVLALFRPAPASATAASTPMPPAPTALPSAVPTDPLPSAIASAPAQTAPTPASPPPSAKPARPPAATTPAPRHPQTDDPTGQILDPWIAAKPRHPKPTPSSAAAAPPQTTTKPTSVLPFGVSGN